MWLVPQINKITLTEPEPKVQNIVAMEEEQRRRVCVTGATGYMGSWLVKKLLEKGHVVHATVRNPGSLVSSAALIR